MLAELWNHSCALVGHLETYYGRIPRSSLDQMKMIIEILDRGAQGPDLPVELIAASGIHEHGMHGPYCKWVMDFRRKEQEMARHFWAPACDIPCPD